MSQDKVRYILFALFLAISAGVGLLPARKPQNQREVPGLQVVLALYGSQWLSVVAYLVLVSDTYYDKVENLRKVNDILLISTLLIPLLFVIILTVCYYLADKKRNK